MAKRKVKISKKEIINNLKQRENIPKACHDLSVILMMRYKLVNSPNGYRKVVRTKNGLGTESINLREVLNRYVSPELVNSADLEEIAGYFATNISSAIYINDRIKENYKITD